MDRSDASRGLFHVVVVGGGFAALETVLGLRALAGDAVRISLVSPERVFAYRPAATLEAFGDVAPSAFDLDVIAADLGVGYHRTRVESVAGVRRRVRLGSGGRLTYDALVLAAGARATVGVPGALTFRDQRDLPASAFFSESLTSANSTRSCSPFPQALRGRCPYTSWRCFRRRTRVRSARGPRSR